MSHLSEEDIGDLIYFKWGRQRGVGVKNKGFRFYESFIYEEVEYFLYDCVYFFHVEQVETSIGKLVRMYETPYHKKMVKVVWFFRPSEVRNFLGNYQPRWNELFLASGAGKGVSNVNRLESIIGKCSVVCTSKDKRNPQPSKADINKADFFFNRTYDVGRHAIVDKFADEIDGVKVEQFFNRKRGEKTGNHVHVGKTVMPKTVMNTTTDCFDMLHCQVKDKADVRTSENSLPMTSILPFPTKKMKFVIKRPNGSQSNKSPEEEKFHEKKAELVHDKSVKTYGEVIEVTERPNAGKRRWFNKGLWVNMDKIKMAKKTSSTSYFSEVAGSQYFNAAMHHGSIRKQSLCINIGHRDEIIQQAKKLGTLVLLNNLDPSYTSDEVEDLVWHALKEKVTARMIEWSLTSNPYYGRALVVFKTKDAAESAISELNRRCLILGDGRVVSAENGILIEADKRSKFLGHLVIDSVASRMNRPQMRNAKSTSHCSQPNSIEYGMAIEWQMQYDKANAWSNALYQRQMREIEDVKSKLDMDRIFFKSNASRTSRKIFFPNI